jgi:hypothetical protein
VPCVTKSWQTSRQGTNEPLLMEKKSKVRTTKCTKITGVKSSGTVDYGVELEEIVKDGATYIVLQFIESGVIVNLVMKQKTKKSPTNGTKPWVDFGRASESVAESYCK